MFVNNLYFDRRNRDMIISDSIHETSHVTNIRRLFLKVDILEGGTKMILGNYEWSYEKFTWVFEVVGGSPVIISVPHNRGFSHHELLGLLEPRKNGVKGRDAYIWRVAKDILLRAKVNAVRGLFPRHFIDYNRSLEGINYYPLSQTEVQTALEDSHRLQQFYDHYHQEITNLINRAIEIYGQNGCLLIDLHGFAKQPPHGEYDLIFGTGNRITIRSEVDRDMAKFLSSRDYKVFLPADESIGPSEDSYSADFTTRHYAEKFGIDAIQIEVAKKFRVREGEEIGQRLSADLAEFLTEYFNLQKI